MHFVLVPRGNSTPQDGRDIVYLTVDLWNDYSFITMFFVEYRDSAGQLHQVGQTKIGFRGQTTSQATYKLLPVSFPHLEDSYFSVGQDVDFYKRLRDLPDDSGKNILKGLRDLVAFPETLKSIENEEVLRTSLLRSVSVSSINEQFSRILAGKAELTNYKFSFNLPGNNGFDDINLAFQVNPFTSPSTNVHAIIGRNGVGKTTILNSMISALTSNDTQARFNNLSNPFNNNLSEGYFASLISVSFSAFDPFTPPIEQPDPAKGTCYYYVGLKDSEDSNRLRTLQELRRDCSRALSVCFSNRQKTIRWKNAIEKLNSDDVFSSMGLSSLLDSYESLSSREGGVDLEKFYAIADSYQERMSSGHAVVFLTIAKVISTAEEKTLVLIDEPESHLHPPLLSAFIRALADLLNDRNGVSIIATHSPVVLQEIPKSCVWKVHRIDQSIKTTRPKIETFGESVGLLTSEVFGLEVSRSGFHDLLRSSVKSGQTYEAILAEYGGQLGFEGRAVLTALLEGVDLEGERD